MQKLVLVGGSSFSTVALLDYLGGLPGAPDVDVCLVGRDLRALAAVERAGRMLTAGGGLSIRSQPLAELPFALTGADIVVLQIRVGGFDGRHFVERFARRHGIVGDEALGAGGLAVSWQAWPTIADILKQITIHCPTAFVLVLTSPPGLLVRAALMIAPNLKIAGICELPWTSLKAISSGCGVSPASVDFQYVGINHIGWFVQIVAAGRDLVAEYVATRVNPMEYPSRAEIETWSGIPTKYVELHDRRESIIQRQSQDSETRAQRLSAMRGMALGVFSHGTLDEIRRASMLRRAPWYSEAVGPFVEAMQTGRSDHVFFLSVPNDGWHPSFLPSDVLEIPYSMRRGEFTRLPCSGDVSEVILKCIDSFLRYEQVAVEGVVQRDPERIRLSLALHPWLQSEHNLGPLVRDICDPWVSTGPRAGHEEV